VIDLGEVQIFEGQMAQALHGGVDVEAAAANFGE
jgi:hypothetical protein